MDTEQLEAVEVVRVMRMVFPQRKHLATPLLNYYKERGYVVPTGKRRKGYRSNYYTHADVLCLAFNIAMKDIGINANSLQRASYKLFHHADKILRRPNGAMISGNSTYCHIYWLPEFCPVPGGAEFMWTYRIGELAEDVGQAMDDLDFENIRELLTAH